MKRYLLLLSVLLATVAHAQDKTAYPTLLAAPVFQVITGYLNRIVVTNFLGSNEVRLGVAQLSNVSFVAIAEGNSLFWNDTMKKFTNAPGGGSALSSPLSSVQFNSNGTLQGSTALLYTNGAVRGGVSNTLDSGSWAIPNKTNYANAFVALANGTNHLGETVFDNNVTITSNLTVGMTLGTGDHVAVRADGLLMRTNITGGSSVSGNSNQIPYLNAAGTGFIFGATNKNNPGFGFSKAANQHTGALMIHENETNVYSLVAIGVPVLGSSIPFFCPSLTISNSYSYSGSGGKIVQEMVRVTFVDITDGSDPESFIQTWQHQDDTAAPVRVAGIRRDGQILAGHGTYYPSNSLAGTFPTAAQLGVGGHLICISNGPPSTLVDKYSLDGVTVLTKVLAP